MNDIILQNKITYKKNTYFIFRRFPKLVLQSGSLVNPVFF